MKKAIMALSLLLACAFAGCDLGGAPSDNDNNNADSQTAYAYDASESTGNRLYNVDAATGEKTYGTYVEKSDLPGIPKENCTGATKIAYHSASYRKGSYDYLYLQLNYTTSELEELKSEYKSAKFHVYFETAQGVDIIYQNGGAHLLSFVETFNSGWNNNQVHKKVWSEYEIYLSDLIACMNTEETSGDNQTAYIFAGYFSNGHEILDSTMNVYLSDLELIKKAGA
ncbi:MAG: hypothetical protein IJA89_05580 [Clostridia bacterium]|nr:hypothetical protein [Clostridia bacterium]